MTPSGSTPPLRAPKTSDAQDTKFFTDVAEADPALASYQQKQGNIALRALLTDGSAFCALLTRREASTRPWSKRRRVPGARKPRRIFRCR